MDTTLTSRQYVALHLFYVEGWSQRRIGKALGTSQPAVHYLIQRGRRWVVEAGAREGVISLPSVRALLAPAPSSSPTRNLGLAASRREELLDALERRMAYRAIELAELEECMAGNSFHPTHAKRNHYDQWEIRYLCERRGEPMPTNAFTCRTAAQHCAHSHPACGIDSPCFNCHGKDH